MVDPLSTIGAVFSTMKQLREVAQKVKDAGVRELVADLSLHLSDLKMQVADLQAENHALRSKLSSKDGLHSLRQHIERRSDVYFLKAESGRDNGPYCPNCFEVIEKLVPVTNVAGGPFGNFGTYKCPHCSNFYG